MLGKFENSRNTPVLVNNQEEMFAKKPTKKIKPITRTTELLD